MTDIQKSIMRRRMREVCLHWEVTDGGTHILSIEDLKVERRKENEFSAKSLVVTYAGTTLMQTRSTGNLTQDLRDIFRELL